MSGGGASPTIKKSAWCYLQVNSEYRVIAFVLGNRIRIPVVRDVNGEITHIIQTSNYGPTDVRFGRYAYSYVGYLNRQALNKCLLIYGTVNVEGLDTTPAITIGVSTIDASTDYVETNQLFEKCGFVEGVARITTPVGDAACVVKNGTLYPILTEYDQATEDNWTLQDVYLNGDNEVSNLQQMVDRSGTYLAYTEDQEADKWSPIENYLNMHVKMPIVPKIGYVPAQQVGLGDVLPGLNYAVNL